MAKAFVDDTNLTNIANAIRNHNSSTTTYYPSEMADAINGLYSNANKIHVWGKCNITKSINETEVNDLCISMRIETTGLNRPWDNVDFSDEINIINGELSLVNQSTILVSNKRSANLLKGKYIDPDINTDAKYYRVPADAEITYKRDTSTTQSYNVSTLYQLSLGNNIKGDFIENVISENSSEYPTDGEQDGYWYIYMGLLSDLIVSSGDLDINNNSYVWEKYNSDPSIPGTTEKENEKMAQYIYSKFTEVQYSDSIEIVNGELSLVNPSTVKSATVSDYDVIIGKYVYTNVIANANFYLVPSSATLIEKDTNYINSSIAYLLKVKQKLNYVISNNNAAYPTNGEQDGYWYVYKGLLSGFINDSDGTATLQTKTVTPSESSQSVTPDSGYDGLSKVTVNAISSTYVGSGITQKSAATITPSTSNQTIASGTYLSGTQTIKGDSNLVAGNIKSGVSIFGVTGSYTGSGSSSTSTTMKSGTTTSATINTGLSSIRAIVIYKDSLSATGLIQGVYSTSDSTLHYTYCSSYSRYSKSCSTGTSTASSVSGGTFTLGTSGTSGLSSSTTYNWIAFGVA